MKALLYADWHALRMAEAEVPIPGPGEVRLKVQAAGICGSELDAVRSRSPRRVPPLILGHEFTGVVEALGPGVEGWITGDGAVANAVMSDGTCPACLRGETNLCPKRTLFGMHRPGAFAQYVTAPVSALLHRPSGVDPAVAAMAEPLANGIHVAGLLNSVAPETAVVIGAGPIGLFCLQALIAQFASQVAVVDRSESRLELAKKLGADAVFTPEDEVSLRLWMGTEGVPATVDAVGAEPTKHASIRWLRPGGTTVWIGLHGNESSLNSYDLILAEKTVRGSYATTLADLELALDWIRDGEVDAKTWVSQYDLAEADKAFYTMLEPGPGDVKGVIVME